MTEVYRERKNHVSYQSRVKRCLRVKKELQKEKVTNYGNADHLGVITGETKRNFHLIWYINTDTIIAHIH
jgi:hypothetical protein